MFLNTVPTIVLVRIFLNTLYFNILEVDGIDFLSVCTYILLVQEFARDFAPIEFGSCR
jgi:hypothetical protein